MKKLFAALLFVICLAYTSPAKAVGVSVEFYGGCWDCYSNPAFIYTPPPVAYRQVEVYAAPAGGTYYETSYYSSGSHHHYRHHKKHKKYKKHRYHRHYVNY